MEEKKKKGGARKGAGRPKGIRQKTVTLRLSAESVAILQEKENKSRYVDNLIIKDNDK